MKTALFACMLALPAAALAGAAKLPSAPLAQASAAPGAPTSSWRLEDADLAMVHCGWGEARRNLSVDGKPLVIGGKTFEHGLGVHAESHCTIGLDGNAAEFRALVGINEPGGNEPGRVEFRVVADGKTVWRSGDMKRGDQGKPVAVPLAGVKRLRLEVDALGDISSDHANWADAAITYAGAAPRCIDPRAPYEPAALYPPASQLTASPGDTTYFVDPASGDDAAAGTAKDKPWKSFAKLNAMKFAPGDKVVIAPGFHAETLKPSGAGTAAKPVTLAFAPGRHEFGDGEALRRPCFVSNSCDDPLAPKPIGILLENIHHFRLVGGGAGGPGRTDIVYMGRMIQILNDHAEDIEVSGIGFDLKRPTVSEFRCLEASPGKAVLQIAEGSDYAITDGVFSWTGDFGDPVRSGWCQEAIPEEGRCWRRGALNGWSPAGQLGATARDLGGRKVEFIYPKNDSGLTAGHQYHFRVGKRDSVGVHSTRSKDIRFHDCNFYALTNMGVVSQFTENMSFHRVNVAPPAGSGRTCAAWADIFQFSNCRGDLFVEDCRLSGMQDDSINCHGTHLRIVGQPAGNQLLLRFMHPQTYGFAVYAPGDEIAVIHHANLRELPGNPRRRVTAVEAVAGTGGKDWRVTLDGPAPAFGKDDVIDNITWYPNLTARNNHISVDPVRGFLITTRGKVLVEGNTFHRCAMAGILIEDDAEGWFESGPVRDLMVRGNHFIGCGVEINPMSKSADPEEPVHENIRIENNFFAGAGVSAHHVRGLSITGNRSPGGSIPLRLAPTCTQVKAEGNDAKAEK